MASSHKIIEEDEESLSLVLKAQGEVVGFINFDDKLSIHAHSLDSGLNYPSLHGLRQGEDPSGNPISQGPSNIDILEKPFLAIEKGSEGGNSTKGPVENSPRVTWAYYLPSRI